jgi:urocanate hydratase
MGGSISAGHIVVADGTDRAAKKRESCLHVDPAIGVIRHADVDYDEAEAVRMQAHPINPMQQ